MPNYRELDEVATAIVDRDSSTMAEFILSHHCDIPVCECSNCNEYTHHDETRTVDDDIVCEGCAESAHYWESDNEYHWDEEPNSDEYHDYGSFCPNAGFSGAVGIELELQFFDDATDVIERSEDSGVWVENDSSLTLSNSAEAITQPFRADRAGLKRLGGLTSFLDTVRCGGWGRENYGIHINLNRGHYSPYDVIRALTFVKDNAGEVARCCGRDRIYDGNHGIALNEFTLDRMGVARGYTRKYSPIHMQRNRVEFRIFQANAKAERVADTVRFAQDVMEFSQSAGYRGLNWSAFCASFPRWTSYRIADDCAVSA